MKVQVTTVDQMATEVNASRMYVEDGELVVDDEHGSTVAVFASGKWISAVKKN